jgi:hypothetical protein
MSPWLNFGFIIAGQFVVLLLILRLQKVGVAAALPVIWRSLLLGIPLGLVYDYFIGHGQSIFVYRGMPDSWLFTFANGALSYGLAIAAARFIPFSLERLSGHQVRLVGAGILAFTLLAVLLYLQVEMPILPSMFMFGAALILASEGLAVVAGFSGPVLSILRGRIFPLAKIWLYGVIIGAAYELLNYVFPLWHWVLADSHPPLVVEALVIGLGYTALFLPMVLISHLLIRFNRPTDEKDTA